MAVEHLLAFPFMIPPFCLPCLTLNGVLHSQDILLVYFSRISSYPKWNSVCNQAFALVERAGRRSIRLVRTLPMLVVWGTLNMSCSSLSRSLLCSLTRVRACPSNTKSRTSSRTSPLLASNYHYSLQQAGPTKALGCRGTGHFALKFRTMRFHVPEVGRL